MVSAVVLLFALAVAISVAVSAVKITRNDYGDIKSFEASYFQLSVAALVLIAGAILSSSFGQVPAGTRGVVLRFGAVTGEVKNEGLYFVTPMIESVRLMDVQIHAHKAPATAASRDMQDVATEITLNYRLDPATVADTWRELGNSYEERIITPSVQEAVKAATAKYDAEQLITMRAAVRGEIENTLRERLARHHVILDQVSITNFQFSKAFAEAIEGKQVATQNALKAQNEVVEAKAKADAAIATARGTAESIRIQAEAIRAQGGAEYVQLEAIKKWKGEVPQWVTSTNSIPFINMSKQLV